MNLLKKMCMGSIAGLLMLVGIASADSLRVGVEGAFPPFSWKDADGSLKGFDIDIALALCEEMGAECSLVEQDWDGMIPALIAGKYDMIVASMSITDERKKQVSFSNKYYNTPNRLVAHKNSGISSLADLDGKKIGVQRGTIHQCYAEKVLKNAALKLYATQEEVFLDLAAGRIDAQISDSIQAEEGFLKTPKGADFMFVAENQFDPPCHGEGAGIALRKGEDDLRSRLNKAIATIRENGTYQRINNKYFTFDVYGN